MGLNAQYSITYNTPIIYTTGFVFPALRCQTIFLQEIKRSHDSSLTPADFDLGGKFTKDASLGHGSAWGTTMEWIG